jgi:hypothetical protein
LNAVAVLVDFGPGAETPSQQTPPSLVTSCAAGSVSGEGTAVNLFGAVVYELPRW